MNYIRRSDYLKKFEKFIGKPIIKILTGMRRVGKSTILKMIEKELLKTVADANKIYINFESLEMIKIRDSVALAEYLTQKLKFINGKMYFFFDEIQLVKNWERVINGLQVEYDCDIYLTGSNSCMLSGDFATLLAGRYVNFEIQPFTFREFIEGYKNLDLSEEALFQKYLIIGGMPGAIYYDLEEEPIHKYLNDVYNTVLIKDVMEYNQIRDVDVFNRILLYAIENIGNTFSALGIRKFLKNEHRNVSVDTVLNYLEFCQQAFLLKKVRRYDAIGKKFLKVEEKYYLSDHGFRQAKGLSNMKDIERVLENIVYIKLLSEDYDVAIGKLYNKEIDFIAKKNEELLYIQVSYLLHTESTRNREFGIYNEIKDNYPKYVLSMDKINFSQNGIIHKNIMDWLLGR